MFSYWSGLRDGVSADNAGGVSFNTTVQVVNADDTISMRQMNVEGGYYDAETEVFDDDGSLSFRLDHSLSDEDQMTFMDAMQENGANCDLSPSSFISDTNSYFRSTG